jgi:HEAT repeat protein
MDDFEWLLYKLKNWDFITRARAAETLGKTGDAQAVEPLCQALNDENEYVCRQAIGALGDIGNSLAIEPLLGFLNHWDEWIRETVAEALGKINDARVIEPLARLLRDESKDVRERAAEALGNTGRREALSVLQKRLVWFTMERDPDVLDAIRKAITKIENVTALTKTLPRPAGVPTPDMDTLPRPADTPTFEVDKLPRPAD